MASKSDRLAAEGEEAGGVPGAANAFDPACVDQDNPKVRQLLDAAGRLFMNLPYDSVSTDAIAREAKVSKATLYVHFSSKENLFATLISDRCNLMADQVWNSSSAIENAEQELRQFARNFIEMLESPDTMPLYRSIVSHSSRSSDLGQLFYETGPKRFEARLTDFLTEATRRGLLRVPNPGLGALQFIHLMAGDLPMKGLLGLKRDPASSVVRMESGIALFLAGYGPQARDEA